MMAEPPSMAGAVNDTVALASPATAVTAVGASGATGAATGVTGSEGALSALLPTALVATTVKV